MLNFFKRNKKNSKFSYGDKSPITSYMLESFGFEKSYHEGHGTLFQKKYYGEESEFMIQVWYEDKKIYCLGGPCFYCSIHCEKDEFKYGTLSRFATAAKMPLYGKMDMKSKHLTEEYVSKKSWLNKFNYRENILKYIVNRKGEIKDICGFFNVAFKDCDSKYDENMCIGSGYGNDYFKASFSVNGGVENNCGFDYFDEDTFDRIINILKELYKK